MNGIKRARLLRGLTQEELGHAIGKANATISQYESGVRKPSIQVLEKIADVLGVSVDFLLNRANPSQEQVHEAFVQYDISIDEPYIKDLMKDFMSLAPEERRAVEIMIKTLLAAKKEQTAAGR